MSIVAKATNFALSNFSPNLRSIFRSTLPLSVKRFLGKAVMKNISNNQSTVASHDGRIFKVIEDRLFLRVVFEKDYEPLLSATAIKIIGKGDNIIDVGANFGWYTTLFCKLSCIGKVISYEPAPHSYKILDENIALNDMASRIDVRKVGVGKEEGSFFMEPGSVSESGLAHVVTDKAATTIEVPVVTLEPLAKLMTSELTQYIHSATNDQNTINNERRFMKHQ
jgi:FkbM family methyltransferase